jgi:tripartite-type tricarboxylate transporter receptor subunit TctC
MSGHPTERPRRDPAIGAAIDRRGVVIGSGGLLAASAALAQERAFPTGPVRVVSPYPPGGGTDTTARIIGPAMGEFLGQPILVENRGGAGGSIGAAEVARSAPDGQTVLVDALGHVVNPHLLKGLAFDYAAFVPVTEVTLRPQVMIVDPRTPAADLAAFLAYAKARAGRLSYGSSGNATGSHLASVLFLRQAGLDMAHVPYRGGSAALQDVLAGNVAFAMATVNSATQLILDGRLRALAVASDRCVASLPKVPTMAEAGFDGVAAVLRHGAHDVFRLGLCFRRGRRGQVEHAAGPRTVNSRHPVTTLLQAGSGTCDADRHQDPIRDRRPQPSLRRERACRDHCRDDARGTLLNPIRGTRFGGVPQTKVLPANLGRFTRQAPRKRRRAARRTEARGGGGGRPARSAISRSPAALPLPGTDAPCIRTTHHEAALVAPLALRPQGDDRRPRNGPREPDRLRPHSSLGLRPGGGAVPG